MNDIAKPSVKRDGSVHLGIFRIGSVRNIDAGLAGLPHLGGRVWQAFDKDGNNLPVSNTRRQAVEVVMSEWGAELATAPDPDPMPEPDPPVQDDVVAALADWKPGTADFVIFTQADWLRIKSLITEAGLTTPTDIEVLPVVLDAADSGEVGR